MATDLTWFWTSEIRVLLGVDSREGSPTGLLTATTSGVPLCEQGQVETGFPLVLTVHVIRHRSTVISHLCTSH